ncbi:hypothetical protein E2562_001236 [Oryza meyeriana var. granulata]|uniref:Uncharacterized protein n=1 Tax=Oryza meyeriana var. granulata TaxID=110450 RepID=A0A6G1DC35_9ORYZ|nr:hypothetical protein E2562_001236 [Oryza meyeriana var. granulata]
MSEHRRPEPVQRWDLSRRFQGVIPPPSWISCSPRSASMAGGAKSSSAPQDFSRQRIARTLPRGVAKEDIKAQCRRKSRQTHQILHC